jgi:hypothetical protein
MNAEFFALAFLAAANPKLLALDLLLIENRRPRAMYLVPSARRHDRGHDDRPAGRAHLPRRCNQGPGQSQRASTWPSACCYSPPDRLISSKPCTGRAAR